MGTSLNVIALGVATLAMAAGAPAWAAPVAYQGEDIVATTSSPHPNSTAAAASFDASVALTGGASTITFENAPVGSFSSLTVAPGVTVSGTDLNGANQRILNASNSPDFPTLDGYNTTAGGTHFLEVFGGTVTFSFATPVYAFGAYFSGVQNFFNDVITFSDGTSQTIAIPNASTSGSVGALDFVGFTDIGKAITSITVNTGNGVTTGADAIGVDDIRYAVAPLTVGATPEPATWAMMVAGFGLVGGAIRRRRTVAAPSAVA